HAGRIVIFLIAFLTILAVITLPIIPIFHQYHPYIRWLVVILIPIISVSSIARGYFMGIQQMGKIAFSNFLRNGVQLLLLAILFRLFQFEAETALFIALCTLVSSELFVFFYLLYAFIVQFQQIKHEQHTQLSGKAVRKYL